MMPGEIPFPIDPNAYTPCGHIVDLNSVCPRCYAAAENARLKAGLRRLLTEADEHNAHCGKPDRLCAYCPTRVYDGVEGIVHSQDCVIRKSRALLSPRAEVYILSAGDSG